MTADAVGARFAETERAPFFRALCISLLIHGVLFLVKVGPVSGPSKASTSGGGVIEAVLKSAPRATPGTMADSPPIPDTALHPAKTLVVDADSTDRPKVEEQREPREHRTDPQPAHTTPNVAIRDTGRDTLAGAATSSTETQAIPLLPPLHSSAREVPQRPMLLAPLTFSYPPGIKIASGRVRVRITIDEKGNVEEMRAVASAPPGMFEQAAIEVLRRGRYLPGRAANMPVRAYLFLDITYGPGPQGQQVWYAGNTVAPPPYLR